MSRAKRPSELLAPGQYDELAATQGGVCAICKKPSVGRRLDIDHNHRTNDLRGLLCSRCNRALPSERLLPKDQPLSAWLFAALVYVAGYEATE